MRGLVSSIQKTLRVEDHKLGSVQAMRAFAALLVCFSHSIFASFHFSDKALLTQLYDLPWRAGVDLFFIISGFIMMYTAGDTFLKERAARTFFLRRLIRIVPTYWFFTTLMVFVALFWPKVLNSTVLTPDHAILSYFFIPHTDPGPNHDIHPLLGLGWTLVYEMFFYAAFALALNFRRRNGLLLLCAGFLALFVTARGGLWTPALNAFWSDSILFEFLLGIAAYLFLSKKEAGWGPRLRCLGFAAATYGLGWLFGWQDERVVQLGAPALALFALCYPLRSSSRAWLALVLIGDASYALYLSHPFAIDFLKVVFSAIFKESPMGDGMIVFFMGLAMVFSVFVGLTFFAICEKPITRALQKRFLKKSAQQSPKRGAA